jgi:hypothetical protein
MESQPFLQQLESQLTQQSATQELKQFPEKPKKCFKRKNKRIGGSHLSNKVKVKKLLVASALIVPPAPNPVPPPAVHPLQEVQQAVPLRPLPPPVQGQPPTPRSIPTAVQVQENGDCENLTPV